jgi:cytochrome c oxidase subunit 2
VNDPHYFLWPSLAQASSHAVAVDWMIGGFALVLAVLSVPVFILMAWFSIKYRRGSAADRSNRPRGDTGLETLWSVGPFVLALGFFGWAAWSYMGLAAVPANALEIDVVAKQWMWKFQHPGGQREIDALHVPVDRPIVLRMISEDVIHSLYLPALRIKQDVLPGRYTTLWFQAKDTGTFRLTCAEFCGLSHAVMGGSVVVMRADAYADWLRGQRSEGTLVAQGQALFRRFGCGGCHDAGGTVHAPPLENLYGSAVPLQGGEVIVADDRYIRDSILLPNKEIAAGYPPIMPSFANQFDEGDLIALIAYIKSRQAQARP